MMSAWIRAALVSVAALLLVAATAPPLINPGFEEVGQGDALIGWKATGIGQRVERATDQPASGAVSAHVVVESVAGAPPAYGALSQTLPAQMWAGQQVRLKARVRTRGLGGGSRVVLWIRTNDSGQEPLSFVDTRRSPIVSERWTDAVLVAPITERAEKVTVGLLVTGAGEAWIDDVELTPLGGAQTFNAPPRALTDQGRRNLVSFAEAFADLRYFYPGDEAARTDWDRIAIAGVAALEDAADAWAAAAALQRVFRPVAPEIQAWPTATPAPPAPILPARGVRWRHEGPGMVGARPYRSERVAAASGPDDLFTVKLANGVSVRFPLVAAATAGPSDQASQSTATAASGNPGDRTSRLADLVVLWAAVREFYPEFTDDAAAWNAAFARALGEAAQAADTTTYLPVVERMIAALSDGHGWASPPEGRPRGRLPLAWDWIGNSLVVTASTAQSGLAVGDVVTRLDGRDSAARVRDEESLVSAATPQWRRAQALERLRARPLAAHVDMEVQRAGRPLSLRLSAEGSPPPGEARPMSYAELRPGIIYVDLTSTDDTALKAAIPRLAEARGVVFDLRGYPHVNPAFLGHLTDRPVNSAEWNVPVLTRPNQEAMGWKASRWTIPPSTPRMGGKMVFLIDRRAISFAESILSVVEGAHLATLVGEPTAGTNGNIVPMRLPTGLTVTWTGMKVVRQDGRPHNGHGVAPDVRVERTVEGIRAGRDETLEAALALFGDGP